MTVQKNNNHEESSEIKQGSPWTKVGVFQTFKEADKRRFEIADDEPTFNLKVKRCGKEGEHFMVKKREDPNLAKISKEMDKIYKKKPQKKKSSRRIRKV